MTYKTYQDSVNSRGNRFLSLIGKPVIMIGLAVSSFCMGSIQNPTFSELPPKAQDAIVQEHRDLVSLIKMAVEKYKQGDSKGAADLYWKSTKNERAMKKSDPYYGEISEIVFDYSAAILSTAQVLEHLDGVQKYVLDRDLRTMKDWRAVAVRVIGPGNFLSDDFLQKIGPDSAEVARCRQDASMKRAVLRNYCQLSNQWYDLVDTLSGEMKQELKRLTTGDGSIPKDSTNLSELEFAIRILESNVKKNQESRKAIQDMTP